MHRFHVPTMTCGGCLGVVTRAVRKLDPQAEVDGDLAKREIILRSDMPEASLLAALRAAGYSSEPIAQPQPAA